MIKKQFHELPVGSFFFLGDLEYQKTEPIKSGGCGCRVIGNAIIKNNGTPVMIADSQEVLINE